MPASRREFILAAAAASLPSPARATIAAAQVTPERFGAKGDGRTNDTSAFTAMSAHLNAIGGGTIVLQQTTYLVGEQHPAEGGNGPSFAPSDIIHLSGCKGSIRIEGNGARLRCAPGLRYGRFDPRTGRPFPDAAKPDATNKAMPYFAMIYIEKCSGEVTISNLELDGNLGAHWIGGRAAPGGWQAGATGIRLIGNTGPETLRRIHSHHHAQDGMILAPTLDRKGSTALTDVVCEFNGRQGCSVTGGRNFGFRHCIFRHTGRAVLHSDPGAGVDIEAEHGPIRNVLFEDCEFSDTFGFGLVSGTGDSADIGFSRCKFVGTTNWAACPGSPDMRFNDCLFAGSIAYCHGDADPARAAHFDDCTFSDDTKFSPTRRLFFGNGKRKWIAVLPKNPNVRFGRCRFKLNGDAILPWSDNEVIYADCVMSQSSPEKSAPLGTYIGTNSISGHADLTGANIRGRVVLNGHLLPQST